MSKPLILIEQNSTADTKFVENFVFKNGHKVPIYEVSSENAFNQIIGYAKFLNQEYGNVYYRGVDGLYPTILPNLMRKRKYGDATDLKKILQQVEQHPILKESLKLLATKAYKATDIDGHKRNKEYRRNNRNRIEALLQHYSGNTRFVDVVDNHWVALWMGLHKFVPCGEGKQHMRCTKRAINSTDIAEGVVMKNEDALTKISNYLYEYVILIAMPYCASKPLMGVSETSDFVEVDLRKALPSFYLRPHAQHALVVRRREQGQQDVVASYFDMASQAVGILRVRTDLANKWLGNGALVSFENLFPSPA